MNNASVPVWRGERRKSDRKVQSFGSGNGNGAVYRTACREALFASREHGTYCSARPLGRHGAGQGVEQVVDGLHAIIEFGQFH